MLPRLLFFTLFYTSTVVHSFECVRDVPSSQFLFQEHSFISYYNIDSQTSIEVQIFNANKLNSTDYSPLLFIHGYTDSRWSFLSTIQCMNIYDRAIIVPSLRGFGDSQIYSVDDSTFSVDEFVNDLIKLLDILNINSAVWIGHSMGSWVTHYAAGMYTNRVDSIILLGPGLTLDETLCSDIDSYINTTCPSREFIDAFQEFDFIASNISLNYAYQVVRESYKVDIEPYQKAWYELCDFNEAETYLGSLTMNVTIIWGSIDYVTPVDQTFIDSFTSTTPTVEIIEGIGHNVQWFAPEQVSNIIKHHINYIPPLPTTTDDSIDAVVSMLNCETYKLFVILLISILMCF